MRCPHCDGELALVKGGPIFPTVADLAPVDFIVMADGIATGSEIHLDPFDAPPLDDGHGDDGDLLAGP